MPTTAEKPKPFLLPEFCKGCGRCIEACARHCIEMGTEINPKTGLVPVVLHLENCSACGLCFTACPAPYGLAPQPSADFELQDPAARLRHHQLAPPPDVALRTGGADQPRQDVAIVEAHAPPSRG